MRADHRRHEASSWIALIAVPLLLIAPASGQVRGLPVFLEAQFPYSERLSIEVGCADEVDGLALIASGTALIRRGACNRLGVSAGAGILNPAGGDFETHFNGGVAVSVLANRCPSPFKGVPNPAVWVIAGVGVVDLDDRKVLNVPIGVGIGYKIEIPAVHLEPWVVPTVKYRESLVVSGESGWYLEVSGGVTLGLSGVAGLRLGVDCCHDGVDFGGRISKWF